MLINSYTNQMGKMASRCANQTTACLCLYLLVGKSLNYIFMEELEAYTNPTARAAIFGGISGLIYKSTRGFRPSIVGMLMGSIIAPIYST